MTAEEARERLQQCLLKKAARSPESAPHEPWSKLLS